MFSFLLDNFKRTDVIGKKTKNAPDEYKNSGLKEYVAVRIETNVCNPLLDNTHTHTHKMKEVIIN